VEHVPFETPGLIELWARERGHTVNRCRMHAGETLPSSEDFDFYVSMGGPMGVSDADRIPFLSREMELMRLAVRADKPALGVCLGAQLLAAALGARVFKNAHREIGWMPVRKTGSPAAFANFPQSLPVLHWHGDTFDLPEGAEHALQSEACKNQAFVVRRAVGLQFHLEMTEDSLQNIIQNCRDDLAPGPFVQTEEEMMRGAALYAGACKTALFGILDRM
jgi:GMP synthase-like glutamine amidotransferase